MVTVSSVQDQALFLSGGAEVDDVAAQDHSVRDGDFHILDRADSGNQ
jgi:hypothetical protein